MNQLKSQKLLNEPIKITESTHLPVIRTNISEIPIKPYCGIWYRIDMSFAVMLKLLTMLVCMRVVCKRKYSTVPAEIIANVASNIPV